VVAKGEPIAESPVLEQERQVDSGNVKSAIETAEPAIIAWAYSVKVRGVVVRCRTLGDVVALVNQYGGQQA
jgi:hypothetical protein